MHESKLPSLLDMLNKHQFQQKFPEDNKHEEIGYHHYGVEQWNIDFDKMFR